MLIDYETVEHRGQFLTYPPSLKNAVHAVLYGWPVKFKPREWSREAQHNFGKELICYKQ